jgi:hypothetical protein
MRRVFEHIRARSFPEAIGRHARRLIKDIAAAGLRTL